MSSNSIDKITLIRGLGLVAAISIIIGNVIGTGVFLKARVMTCNVGRSDLGNYRVDRGRNFVACRRADLCRTCPR